MMRQEDEAKSPDSIGLFISLLVRYPELTSINFDPETRCLRLSFLLDTVLGTAAQAQLSSKLTDSLTCHALITGVVPETIKISTLALEIYTFVEVWRDLDTITKEEINLLVELMLSEFPDKLIIESRENLEEDDQLVQEELIGHMLDHFRIIGQTKRLSAFRENGRVLVFNK